MFAHLTGPMADSLTANHFEVMSAHLQHYGHPIIARPSPFDRSQKQGETRQTRGTLPADFLCFSSAVLAGFDVGYQLHCFTSSTVASAFTESFSAICSEFVTKIGGEQHNSRARVRHSP
jgi:hypothetical protein